MLKEALGLSTEEEVDKPSTVMKVLVLPLYAMMYDMI